MDDSGVDMYEPDLFGVHDVGDVLGGILLGALTLYFWVKLDVAGRLIAALELFGLPKLVLRC